MKLLWLDEHRNSVAVAGSKITLEVQQNLSKTAVRAPPDSRLATHNPSAFALKRSVYTTTTKTGQKFIPSSLEASLSVCCRSNPSVRNQAPSSTFHCP